jgi:ATP-dependent DNA helicase RecG
MNKNELRLILEEGEGYKIEFKESLTNIDREIVAFANSSGGKIFLGITDDSRIKGILITNKLRSQIQDIANNCRPKIKIIFEEHDNILIINVREGEDKPYECSSGFFKRLGANSQKMTRNEILESFKSEGKTRFDELTEPKFDYPKDFDKNKLMSFLELAEFSKSIKPDTILTNVGVAVKQKGKLYFNNSGVLFFAKEPQRFVPWSVFTVALFKDKKGVDVIDRKEITGSLFEIVDKVMDFVRLYAKVAYRFTGKPQREEIYEYPFEAIREAVINSVMHKDYFEHGHNNILKFFPDKIQIENIWVKPKTFIVGKTVFRRNHLIADLFLRIRFGEKLGSGMLRMKDICRTEKAPSPGIEFTDTHFYITFRQSREYLKVMESENVKAGWGTELNERQKLAIDFIEQNGKITNRDYRKLCDIGWDTAHRELQLLVKKKVLKREGFGRATYYRMIIG